MGLCLWGQDSVVPASFVKDIPFPIQLPWCFGRKSVVRTACLWAPCPVPVVCVLPVCQRRAVAPRRLTVHLKGGVGLAAVLVFLEIVLAVLGSLPSCVTLRTGLVFLQESALGCRWAPRAAQLEEEVQRRPAAPRARAYVRGLAFLSAVPDGFQRRGLPPLSLELPLSVCALALS